MIDVGNQLAQKLQQMGSNAAIAIFVLILVATFAATRSVVKVLALTLVGAFFLVAVNGPTWFRDKVKSDLGALGVTTPAPAPVAPLVRLDGGRAVVTVPAASPVST